MFEIVWEPSREYIERSNVKRFMDKYGVKDYAELVNKSTQDIEWFWNAIMEDLGIEWYTPYTKVLDMSDGIEWTKWFIGGKINIVHNCLDRHSKKRDKICCIWESEDGKTVKLTYSDLYREVSKLANGLKSLGIQKGNTVGLYMGMTPEVVIAMLASLKIGAICIPIFSGFGSHALFSRLTDASVKLLIVSDGTLRRGRKVEIKKEADIAIENVPTVRNVIVHKRLGIDINWFERDIWWHELVAQQDEDCKSAIMDSEDYSFILYSSGTTGKPKGTVHTHGGCMAQMAKELAYYFDVKDDDIFFWLTDIGWMMGPWMIIGVLTFGGTILILEGAPDYPTPDKLWQLVDKHKVTIFGISPTAIRMLRRYGDEWVNKHKLSTLRVLGSTGEPWDFESWMWFFEKVGHRKLPIINISGGTEIVGCFLSPLPITSLKPCTLRGPGLGMDIDVYDDYGNPVRGRKGHLVAKKPAPSMTRGFWNDPQRYIETYWSRWKNVWYHGDWASVDSDGYWYLHGRSDDTIKVAGRRIGPAEIEGVLMEHPGISECVAIGVPDELKGESIVCFVVLRPGYEHSEKLREELKVHVTKSLGKTLRPDVIKFTRDIPKTRSAKIVRGLIRAKYLGESIGDISSVENPNAFDEITRAI